MPIYYIVLLIFGAIEIIEEDTKRAMTARCKTSTSIIYHLSEETFRRLVLRYSETVIRKKQDKLLRYI